MDIVIAHGADISENTGGTNRVTAFANGLASADHQVTLVCPPPTGEVDRLADEVSLELAPPNLSGIASQPVRGLSVSLKAKRIAERKGGVLQFEHSSLAGVGALVGCNDYILDMHDLVFPSPLYSDLPLEPLVRRGIKQIERQGLKHASMIVVVSDRMKQLVRDEWNVPVDTFVTIANGYFDEAVAPYRDIPTQAGRVVFLGSLHPKLDLQVFADIATLPDVTELVVIGDGPLRESFEKLAKKRRSLTVRGRLPDEVAFPLLASAEVAINPQNPSRLQEASSPVKLYYYSALGVPMVVSEGPDLVTELTHNDAAVAVSNGESFVAAVEALLVDPERRRRLAKRAKQCSAEYTWDARTEQLLEFYRAKIQYNEISV